jgi:hypothetical protein
VIPHDSAGSGGRATGTQPAKGTRRRAVLVRLSTVAPESVDWLWPGRIPFGKLTLLVGDPDLGKSFIMTDIAARVTTRKAWPSSSTIEAPSGHVIVLTAEDGLADTVRPRVDWLGGNPARVDVLTAVVGVDGEEPFSLSRDLPALEHAIGETGARLVGIDPLSAYLGDSSGDSHTDAEIRRVLGPVSQLADRTQAAVLGIMHLTKNQMTRLLYRVQGNIAFVAAARSVLAVTTDPDDDTGQRRFFLHTKSNLSRKAPTLAYRIAGGPDASAFIAWEPEPAEGISPASVIRQEETAQEHKARATGKGFLERLLAQGPVAASQVWSAAKANGITDWAVRQGKDALGVEVTKIGQPTKPGQGWFWDLPPSTQRKSPPPSPPSGETPMFPEGEGLTKATAGVPRNRLILGEGGEEGEGGGSGLETHGPDDPRNDLEEAPPEPGRDESGSQARRRRRRPATAEERERAAAKLRRAVESNSADVGLSRAIATACLTREGLTAVEARSVLDSYAGRYWFERDRTLYPLRRP